MLIECDSCEPVAINGTPAHESGCPESKKQWVCAPSSFRTIDDDEDWEEHA